MFTSPRKVIYSLFRQLIDALLLTVHYRNNFFNDFQRENSCQMHMKFVRIKWLFLSKCTGTVNVQVYSKISVFSSDLSY